MSKLILLLALAFIFTGCKDETNDSVAFLGLSNDGNVIKHYINHKMTKKIGESLEKSSNEIVDGLNENLIEQKSQWSLDRITVGLSVEAGFDIKIAELETEGAFEMRFEPQKN